MRADGVVWQVVGSQVGGDAVRGGGEEGGTGTGGPVAHAFLSLGRGLRGWVVGRRTPNGGQAMRSSSSVISTDIDGNTDSIQF